MCALYSLRGEIVDLLDTGVRSYIPTLFVSVRDTFTPDGCRGTKSCKQDVCARIADRGAHVQKER